MPKYVETNNIRLNDLYTYEIKSDAHGFYVRLISLNQVIRCFRALSRDQAYSLIDLSEELLDNETGYLC